MCPTTGIWEQADSSHQDTFQTRGTALGNSHLHWADECTAREQEKLNHMNNTLSCFPHQLHPKPFGRAGPHPLDQAMFACPSPLL